MLIINRIALCVTYPCVKGYDFFMQQPSAFIIDDSQIERDMLSHQLKKIGVKQII